MFLEKEGFLFPVLYVNGGGAERLLIERAGYVMPGNELINVTTPPLARHSRRRTFYIATTCFTCRR